MSTTTRLHQLIMAPTLSTMERLRLRSIHHQLLGLDRLGCPIGFALSLEIVRNAILYAKTK